MIGDFDHYFLSFGGQLGSTDQEHWSCGIRLAASGTMDLDGNQAYLAEAEIHLIDWLNRAASKVAFGTHLDFLKLNALNTEWNYWDPDNPQTRYTANNCGSGASSLPFQACCVLSWRTDDVARGLASHGRIYSPRPALDTDLTGLFPSGTALGIATSAAQMLNDITWAEGDGDPMSLIPYIMSKGPLIPGHRIDYVEVDNRIDIQRRRGNQLRAVRSAIRLDA